MYSKGGLAEQEGGRCTHPDSRVRCRIEIIMGAAWIRCLGEHRPAVSSGRAEQVATYRLLSSESVTMEHIPVSHFEQTVERCRAERLVLVVQDTITLNDDGLSETSGLDDLGGGGQGSPGILAHVEFAVNAVGRTLGMFEADAEFRQAEGMDSARWIAGLDRAQELALAYPDTRVERSDLLRPRGRLPGADLARAEDRGGGAELWEPVGGRKIEVPARGSPNGRKGRTAKLTLRCTPVGPHSPEEPGGGRAPVRMTAVCHLEEDLPRRLAARNGKRSEPLHRMLLTTEDEAGLETARTTLRWYELRRRIERLLIPPCTCSLQSVLIAGPGRQTGDSARAAIQGGNRVNRRKIAWWVTTSSRTTAASSEGMARRLNCSGCL